MSSPSIARAARAALVALCLSGVAASTAAGAPATLGTATAASSPEIAWTPPVGQDTFAATVSGLRATMKRRAERPTLALHLSEAATVVVGLRRVMTPAQATAGMPVLRFAGKPGLNRFALKAHGLRAGRYTLRIIAVDAAGNESPARRATLRLARR